MTRPRATLVSVEDTPYYHCIGRCVRHAYLCGQDRLTGKSFTHRRQWILERLKLLTQTFAIDLCAYALMSNHYHLVVRIAPDRVKTWSSREVAERWTQLFSGPDLVQRYLAHQTISDTERTTLDALLGRWASRLSDLSWFMRCLNEPIARMANQEDGCTGHFWEGRFKSQALLDDTALLTAMAYVDLNPVRACLAQSLMDSDFTSIQQRLFEIARYQALSTIETRAEEPALLPFDGTPRHASSDHTPFHLQDYLDLVDCAGRLVRTDKRGAIATEQSTLLASLGIAPEEWFKTVTQLQSRFELFVGAPHHLRRIADKRVWRWVRGLAAGRRLYTKANE